MAQTIIPKAKSFSEQLGGAIGRGVGETAHDFVNERQENKALKDRYGIDLTGIRDPQQRSQIVAQELQFGRKRRQAEASGQIDYSHPSKKELPEFDTGINKKNRNMSEGLLEGKTQENIEEKPLIEKQLISKPVAKKPVRKGGLLTQPLMESEEEPDIYNPQEVQQHAQYLQQQSIGTDNPLSYEQALDLATNMNNANITHKNNLDLNRKTRQDEKEGYGQRAVEKLSNVLENPSDELKALFEKYGQEDAENSEDIADFDKKTAIRAKKFKNTLSDIERTLPPATNFNKLKHGIWGENREFDKVRDSVRIKLKPLLDQGLYSTARKALAKAGYQLEGIESILTDLSESSKKSVAQLPTVHKQALELGSFGLPTKEGYTPEHLEKVENSIRDVLKNNPSENLILLRKAYEEKGLDWDTYKSILDKMVSSGDLALNDDQEETYDNLNTPAIGGLGKFFHGLNFWSR